MKQKKQSPSVKAESGNCSRSIIEMKIEDLSPHSLNTELFGDLRPENYESLLKDVKERGIQNPLVVTSNKQILCGRTRWEAARASGMKSVPVIVREDLKEEEDILRQILGDNLLRKHLSQDERAIIAVHLDEFLRRERDRARGKSEPQSEALGGKIAIWVGKGMGTSRATAERLIQRGRELTNGSSSQDGNQEGGSERTTKETLQMPDGEKLIGQIIRLARRLTGLLADLRQFQEEARSSSTLRDHLLALRQAIGWGEEPEDEAIVLNHHAGDEGEINADPIRG